MKKIQIIALKRLIDPNTNKVYTDERLRALNAYYESISIAVNDNYYPNTVILTFEEKHPDYAAGWASQNRRIIKLLNKKRWEIKI